MKQRTVPRETEQCELEQKYQEPERKTQTLIPNFKNKRINMPTQIEFNSCKQKFHRIIHRSIEVLTRPLLRRETLLQTTVLTHRNESIIPPSQ
jgi:hypothetical protein